jgi:hypothetical protein
MPKDQKKHWKIKCPRIGSWENSQETSLCPGKNRGFWHMFPLRNPKMANEPWHMLVITCLDPPDVLLESLKPQKMRRSVAIFPRKNDDNLMDVGFQFKHVLQLVVWICLDMFGLSDSATL